MLRGERVGDLGGTGGYPTRLGFTPSSAPFLPREIRYHASFTVAHAQRHLYHVPRIFDDDIIWIRKGVGYIHHAQVQCSAYMCICACARSAESSRDVSDLTLDRSTCVAFGALYGSSSFLAGEFSTVYRALLVCVWDGVFVEALE